MKKLLFLIAFTILGFTTGMSKTSTELYVGDKAPDFTLQDQWGNIHTISDLRGKKIVLYFYPKDNSPGCTRQACSIRDGFTELQNAGITIFGLSSGNIKSKKKFAEKHHLPFPLLIATQEVLDAYGVNGTIWRLYAPKRYTFLIDENGIIIAIIKDIDLKHHAQQIIDIFNNA